MSLQTPQLSVVSRAAWGASPPRLIVPLPLPVSLLGVVYIDPVHPIDVETIRSYQRLSMVTHGMTDIQSNFVIGRDGRVYEGRGWTTKPDKSSQVHAADGAFLEFAVIGNLRKQPRMHPTFVALQQLVNYARLNNYLTKEYILMGTQDPDKDPSKITMRY